MKMIESRGSTREFLVVTELNYRLEELNCNLTTIDGKKREHVFSWGSNTYTLNGVDLITADFKIVTAELKKVISMIESGVEIHD